MGCCARPPKLPLITKESVLELITPYKSIGFDTDLQSLSLSTRIFLVDLGYAKIRKL